MTITSFLREQTSIGQGFELFDHFYGPQYVLGVSGEMHRLAGTACHHNLRDRFLMDLEGWSKTPPEDEIELYRDLARDCYLQGALLFRPVVPHLSQSSGKRWWTGVHHIEVSSAKRLKVLRDLLDGTPPCGTK